MSAWRAKEDRDRVSALAAWSSSVTARRAVSIEWSALKLDW